VKTRGYSGFKVPTKKKRKRYSPISRDELTGLMQGVAITVYRGAQPNRWTHALKKTKAQTQDKKPKVVQTITRRKIDTPQKTGS
jgi:hypothetical protein